MSEVAEAGPNRMHPEVQEIMLGFDIDAFHRVAAEARRTGFSAGRVFDEISSDSLERLYVDYLEDDHAENPDWEEDRNRYISLELDTPQYDLVHELHKLARRDDEAVNGEDQPWWTNRANPPDLEIREFTPGNHSFWHRDPRSITHDRVFFVLCLSNPAIVRVAQDRMFGRVNFQAFLSEPGVMLAVDGKTVHMGAEPFDISRSRILAPIGWGGSKAIPGRDDPKAIDDIFPLNFPQQLRYDRKYLKREPEVMTF